MATLWGPQNYQLRCTFFLRFVLLLTTTFSGGVVLHEKQPLFLIDNVTDEFSMHDVESGSLIWSYSMKLVVSKPKQVAFGEKGAIVVRGRECGGVHIFDCKSGGLVQKLQHANKGLIQTIAVHAV